MFGGGQQRARWWFIAVALCAGLAPAGARAQDYGQTSTGRGIGFSYREKEEQPVAEKRQNTWDRTRFYDQRDPAPRGRGIEGSPTNLATLRCQRAKHPEQLEKRGALASRLGQYAPARAEYVRDFKHELLRVTSTEIERSRGIEKASVHTATPPACIQLEHEQYGELGLYRGTVRDTLRGVTIIRQYDYRAGLGAADSFWMRYLLDHTSVQIYFKWFFHNWELLPVDEIRAKLGRDLYDQLQQRLASIEEWGIAREPRGYHLEITDRDVIAFLERHPDLQARFYRATFLLDRAQ